VAAIATGEAEFFARLAGAGVLVRLRYSAQVSGAVTGYAVGWPGHVTGAGDTVWYRGGRLAPDLTLPHLRSRWTGTPPPGAGGRLARLAAIGSVPPDVAGRAARTVRDATAAMRDAASPAVAAAIASAAADLLTATARAWEGDAGGPISDAADWFDRAAHDQRPIAARRVSQAGHLRAMARLVAVIGTLSRDRDTVAALHLVFTLAAFAESLADLREAQDRLHQAQAARHAAGHLRDFRPPTGAATARTPDARSAQPITPGQPAAERRGPHR